MEPCSFAEHFVRSFSRPMGYWPLPYPVSLVEPFVYLDVAASTPLDDRVFAAMEPWLFAYFANPSHPQHAMGMAAQHALESSRTVLAELLGCSTAEVFFTSSATESNNLILRGLVQKADRKRYKLAYGATEHASITETVAYLTKLYPYLQAVPLPVDTSGQIVLEEARRLLDEHTLCVCVMDVNNETGIAQHTLPALAEISHSVGAHWHVDAAQGCARLDDLSWHKKTDSLVLSSAKIYGPKGVSALVVRNKKARKLSPQLTGGGHEQGLRSGTPQVAAVVGMAKAFSLQREEVQQRTLWFRHLENVFVRTLGALDSTVSFFCSLETCPEKVPGILCLVAPQVNPVSWLERIPNIAVGLGSACKKQGQVSPVLTAMGVDVAEALASVRVSFGIFHTEEQVVMAARLMAEAIASARSSHGVVTER